MFEMFRIAMNGDKAQAHDYIESLRARVRGDDVEKPSRIVIGSAEEWRAVMSGR